MCINPPLKIVPNNFFSKLNNLKIVLKINHLKIYIYSGNQWIWNYES